MSKIRYVAVPDVRAKAVTSSQITASSAETGREDDEEREKEKDAPARPRDDDFAALLRELPASAARIARAPIAPVTELAAHVMNEKRPRALVDRARLDALLNDDLAPPPSPPPSSSPQLEIEPPSAALLDAMETAAEDEPDDDAIAPVETPIPSSPRAPSATASTFRAVADARAGRCRAALALAPVPTTTLDARMKRDRAPFDAAARRAMSRALSDDLTLAGGGGGGGGDGGRCSWTAPAAPADADATACAAARCASSSTSSARGRSASRRRPLRFRLWRRS
jgi:hypothetical protein